MPVQIHINNPTADEAERWTDSQRWREERAFDWTGRADYYRQMECGRAGHKLVKREGSSLYECKSCGIVPASVLS